jgi:phage virion morphogenesis protein
MTGAKLTIEVNDRPVLAALERLFARMEDPAPALRDIGETLLNSHRRRFEEGIAPDGTPWVPLSPAYQRRKKKNQDKILVLDGHLEMLNYDVKPDGLELGTNRIYGATHQFGAPERNIPARSFLGLSDDDRTDVLEILREYLRG